MKAPRVEGTYVLEVSASWLSVGTRESSVLGRFIRRRRPAVVPNSAVRRVVFTVIDPAASKSAAGHEGHGRETEVDSIDLTRSRSYRPLAAGRTPVAQPGQFAWAVPTEALIEPSRRERLMGWIMRTGAEASKLDPVNTSGLAWSAVGLKVAHPDRPHRLTLKVNGGEPAALGVAVIEPGGGGSGLSPRLLLDACASGPPILQDGPAAPFSWLVWPKAAEMVLVLTNRSPDAEVRLGTVSLTELDGLPGAAALTETRSASSRMLGLYLAGPHALEPFGGDAAASDPLTVAQNLARYLGYCGATAVALPERLSDRSVRRRLRARPMKTRPAPTSLKSAAGSWHGRGFPCGWSWTSTVQTPCRGCLVLTRPKRPGAGSSGWIGREDRSGPAYHPLNPEVRDAMKRRVVEALAQNQRTPRRAKRPGRLAHSAGSWTNPARNARHRFG